MAKDYTLTFGVNHNEEVSVTDKETGEIRYPKKRQNNIPEGKRWNMDGAIFVKSYKKSWQYFKDKVSPIEFKAAYSLSLMAHKNTNSLQPLNSETTLRELEDVLCVSKNKVKEVMDALFEYGVFGEFKVKDESKPYTQYYIFNPYLSFDGRLIDNDIAKLFQGTKIAQYYLFDKKY